MTFKPHFNDYFHTISTHKPVHTCRHPPQEGGHMGEQLESDFSDASVADKMTVGIIPCYRERSV